VVIGAAICVICGIGENCLCGVVDSGVSGNEVVIKVERLNAKDEVLETSEGRV
jgi:hypothetical protein